MNLLQVIFLAALNTLFVFLIVKVIEYLTRPNRLYNALIRAGYNPNYIKTFRNKNKIQIKVGETMCCSILWTRGTLQVAAGSSNFTPKEELLEFQKKIVEPLNILQRDGITLSQTLYKLAEMLTAYQGNRVPLYKKFPKFPKRI